ncbi:gliding motility-associated C-terminal domain-containing protein, partial [Kriegella aquimaris]
ATQLFNALGGSPHPGGSWAPALAGAGTYTYTMTQDPCSVSSKVVVTEETRPDAGSNATLEICAGATITQTELLTLLGTKNTSGIWNPNPEDAGPGSYTYTVTGGQCPDASSTITVTVSTVDTDGDGIIDCEELTDGTDPLDDCDSIGGTPLPTSNCDSDELTEKEESIIGTDPTNPDTDGDGVIDGHEVTDSTNPLDICDFLLESQTVTPSNAWYLSDCDEDMLSNQKEIELATDPTNPDTDGDTIKDGQEVTDGTDPLDPCDSIGGTPPTGSSCQVYVELDLVQPGDIEHGNLKIININLFPNNNVQVYNRWGVVVWETKRYDNRSNAFDGTSKGRLTVMANQKLPSGVYFYEIKYLSKGQEKLLSGYLYLIR